MIVFGVASILAHKNIKTRFKRVGFERYVVASELGKFNRLHPAMRELGGGDEIKPSPDRLVQKADHDASELEILEEDPA